MAEIDFKQDQLPALHVPRIAFKTRLTVVAATALVAICAHIAVPLGFTPVPVTMQTFAVLLLGMLFTPGAAFACLALYLAEGAVGLPVFSPHGPGGIAQLFGPTGGYLLSYPFAAALTSLLYHRGRRSFLTALTAAGLGSVVILAARRYLARGFHSLEVFCCFRSVGRTVPPRRCRQDPRRDGLRKHIGIVRQRFPRPGSIRSLCRGLSERTL